MIREGIGTVRLRLEEIAYPITSYHNNLFNGLSLLTIHIQLYRWFIYYHRP